MKDQLKNLLKQKLQKPAQPQPQPQIQDELPNPEFDDVEADQEQELLQDMRFSDPVDAIIS